MSVHEMMHWVKHKKKGGEFAAVMKIDLNEAYGRIIWDFIVKVLQIFGFPN